MQKCIFSLFQIEEMYLPVDKRLIEKIYEYVSNGTISVSTIQIHLDHFVRKELFRDKPQPTWLSRRFCPSNKDVGNHVYAARTKLCKSKCDHENLEKTLEEWKTELPNVHFYFRPSGETDTEEKKNYSSYTNPSGSRSYWNGTGTIYASWMPPTVLPNMRYHCFLSV